VVLETNNSTPWLTYSLKPVPFTDRSYVLAGRSAERYNPRTVTDPSGAVVAGAEVHGEQSANGDTRTVKDSSPGEYVFADLPASTYDLSVKGTGFKEYVSHGVELFVSSTRPGTSKWRWRRDRADRR